MMTDLFVKLSRSNAEFLKYAVADIPEGVFAKAHTHLPNHPAWTVGHLTFVRAALPAMMGSPGPVTPDDRYGPGSDPNAASAVYPAKAQLLADLDAAQAHFEKVLAGLTAQQLAAPTPGEGLRKVFPTVQDMLLGMLTRHDNLHIGQLTDWRRAQGLSRLIV